MKPKYELHVISQNLRKEETIVQIAEELQHLSDVSNDIFNKIQARIKRNSEHLSNLNSRIDLVSRKIERLSGSTKATQVFSCCKYPATECNKHYESIFSDAAALPFNNFEHNYSSSKVKDEPISTLQFYHVKVKQKAPKQKIEKSYKDVECVNDLIVFNAGVSSQDVKIEKHVRDEQDIGDAPHSICERNVPIKNVKESYSYLPDLGNVPAINVPIDLPDLPGIAGDVRYTIEDRSGIAPSGVLLPTQLQLEPTIVQNETKVEEVLTVSTPPTSTSTPSVVVETMAPKVVIQVPTEPAPTVQVKTVEVSIEHPKAKAAIQVAAIPETEIKQDVPANIKKENKEIKLKVDDARANLMESIRQAGGKKTLKPAEKTTEEKKATSGDLMADLHAKLSLRRKGISGDKNKEYDAQTALDKISAMIPPPPLNNADNSNSEDDEWDE